MAKNAILHISADYPSPFDVKAPTVAISDMLDAASEKFDNYLLVPKRQRAPVRFQCVKESHKLYLSFFDPLSWLGIGIDKRLDWVRLVIDELLDGVVPAVVHSHKLSYEARIGAIVASCFGVPHIITVRGHSDTHSRNLNPWAARVSRRLLENSAKNLWLSAWAIGVMRNKAGYKTTSRDLVFPSALSDDLVEVLKPVCLDQKASIKLVCVCRLNDLSQKGIFQLMAGLALVVKGGGDYYLDLIGRYDDVSLRTLEGLVQMYGLRERVQILGPMAREEVLSALPGYSALVMTSERETFGLVYLEALFSGLPFVYLAGRGVDGHEFAVRFGYRVGSREPEALAGVLQELGASHLLRRRDVLRARQLGELWYLTGSGLKDRYLGVLGNL